MKFLKNGHNHMKWNVAKEAIDNHTMDSVAVCRDMIITRSTTVGRYGIVYRGEECGTLENGEFTADRDLSPTTKLVTMRLAEEGIID